MARYEDSEKQLAWIMKCIKTYNEVAQETYLTTLEDFKKEQSENNVRNVIGAQHMLYVLTKLKEDIENPELYNE